MMSDPDAIELAASGQEQEKPGKPVEANVRIENPQAKKAKEGTGDGNGDGD